MSRLMIGLGIFLEGSIGLLSTLGSPSCLIVTVTLLLISGLFSSLALHFLSIILEANTLPKVLEMEAKTSTSRSEVGG